MNIDCTRSQYHILQKKISYNQPQSEENSNLSIFRACYTPLTKINYIISI